MRRDGVYCNLQNMWKVDWGGGGGLQCNFPVRTILNLHRFAAKISPAQKVRGNFSLMGLLPCSRDA